MARIVLVGAGSVEFTRTLLADFLAPRSCGPDIVLHDIDPDRLRTAERMAGGRPMRWLPSHRTAHLDRREALTGADFVVNTIQVGGARATQIDFDVPARYGLRYTIDDTINVGGVIRGLRTIPVVLDIARDMESCAPTRGCSTTPTRWRCWCGPCPGDTVKVAGLCHSVFWTIDRLAGYLGVPREDLSADGGRQPPGVRTAPRAPGHDVYPGSGRSSRRAGPGDDLVRRTCSGGSATTRPNRRSTRPSTTHGTSPRGVTPWTGSTSRSGSTCRVANHLDEYAETKRRLDAGETFPIERSGEYAAMIAIRC